MNELRKFLILCFGVWILSIFGTFVVTAQDGCDCERIPQMCVVPITTLNGQGYQSSGVEGGLTIFDPSDPARTDSAGNPLPPEPVSFPPSLFEGVNASPDNVAILVVDSFGEFPGAEVGSYALPDLSSVFDDAQLRDLVRNGTLTHGALVFNHINAMLQGALANQSYTSTSSETEVEWTGPSGERLIVRMVHALSYQTPTPTGVVAAVLSDAIADLSSNGVDRFIVNMSFALLRCDIAQNYDQVSDANPDVLFDQYAARVKQDKELLYRELITPFALLSFPDPLQYLIHQCAVPVEASQAVPVEASQDDNDVVSIDIDIEYPEVVPPIELPCDPDDPNVEFVGSAGNSGLPYVFYPAAYDEVVSVSAGELQFADSALTSVIGPDLAGYSNFNADIGLLGGWFQLFYIVDDFNLEALPLYYRGTSFSGPVESVCLALNLNSGYCESFRPS